MNKVKRDKLKLALNQIKNAQEIVQDVLDAELDCLSNCPENLQNSSKYEDMDRATCALDDCLSDLDNAIDNIQEAL